MTGSRPEVLAKCQDLDLGLTQIIQRLEQFRFGLAQPQHYPAFGNGAWIQFLGPSQHFQG